MWGPNSSGPTSSSTLSGHSRSVADVYASRVSAEAVSADVGGSIKVWDVRSARCTQSIEPPGQFAGRPRPLVFCGEVHAIVLVGAFREWHVYRPRLLTGLLAAPLSAARVSRRHGLLVLAQGNTLSVVDTLSGALRGTCLGSNSAEVTSIAFEPSERCMMVGSSDGVVAIWQLQVSSHARRSKAARLPGAQTRPPGLLRERPWPRLRAAEALLAVSALSLIHI